MSYMRWSEGSFYAYRVDSSSPAAEEQKLSCSTSISDGCEMDYGIISRIGTKKSAKHILDSCKYKAKDYEFDQLCSIIETFISDIKKEYNV